MGPCVHDVGVSASSVPDVVKGSALDGDVGGVDASSTGCGELSSFELSEAELGVASVVSSVVEVDVGVPARAVDTVVALFGGELDGAGLHVNKIITSRSMIMWVVSFKRFQNRNENYQYYLI